MNQSKVIRVKKQIGQQQDSNKISLINKIEKQEPEVKRILKPTPFNFQYSQEQQYLKLQVIKQDQVSKLNNKLNQYNKMAKLNKKSTTVGHFENLSKSLNADKLFQVQSKQSSSPVKDEEIIEDQESPPYLSKKYFDSFEDQNKVLASNEKPRQQSQRQKQKLVQIKMKPDQLISKIIKNAEQKKVTPRKQAHKSAQSSDFALNQTSSVYLKNTSNDIEELQLIKIGNFGRFNKKKLLSSERINRMLNANITNSFRKKEYFISLDSINSIQSGIRQSTSSHNELRKLTKSQNKITEQLNKTINNPNPIIPAFEWKTGYQPFEQLCLNPDLILRQQSMYGANDLKFNKWDDIQYDISRGKVNKVLLDNKNIICKLGIQIKNFSIRSNLIRFIRQRWKVLEQFNDVKYKIYYYYEGIETNYQDMVDYFNVIIAGKNVPVTPCCQTCFIIQMNQKFGNVKCSYLKCNYKYFPFCTFYIPENLSKLIWNQDLYYAISKNQNFIKEKVKYSQIHSDFISKQIREGLHRKQWFRLSIDKQFKSQMHEKSKEIVSIPSIV